MGNEMLQLRINPIVAKNLKNIRDYIAEDREEYANLVPGSDRKSKNVKEYVEIYHMLDRYQDITEPFD